MTGPGPGAGEAGEQACLRSGEVSAGSLEAVTSRLSKVRSRIAAAGGDPDKVKIVAVTKGHGIEAVRLALRVGLSEIGENYAGELVSKATVLAATEGAAVRWHFLGAVQRNKVARLAKVVSCWQSVSRTEEAEAIARHSGLSTPPEIFVEVNFAGDAQRTGCAPEEVATLVKLARRSGCEVRGLMTVAPLRSGAMVPKRSPGERARSSAEDERRLLAQDTFSHLAEIGRRLEVRELSMGMSEDLEQAVAAGTTMLRLGTALFGPRPVRSPHTQSPGLQQ